jgi:membrane protease YdiL (CAAX protease family)
LGLLLGQARLDTGTILVPTVMHALMNLKALVIVAGILHRSPG